ncbi:MAG: hypothetical protein AB7Q97_00995 [Gammaproteobacteria bacterium]
MHLLQPEFAPLLRDFDLQRLDAQHGAVYALWPDLTLAGFNRAWFDFARDNGGEPAISERFGIGARLMDAVPAVLREFVQDGLQGCLDRRIPWQYDYECSSDSVLRRFRQIVYPLGAGTGLLIVNSLLVQHPHDPLSRRAGVPDSGLYRGRTGFIYQCAHCRRIQDVFRTERWDWVPEWVRRPPRDVSHALCPACFGYYYPLPSPG